MEFEKRAMTAEEDKYTFLQSAQISGQTGLIGSMRGDMDGDGFGFMTSWTDSHENWKTPEFKQEFDDMLNSLREEGDILHNLNALASYCYSNPQSKMPSEIDYYGVRVDSEKYAYLLRLNPNKGAYNVYCYCYRKDWLDDHIRAARKGIRFINPHYKELFRIADGEKIREIYSNGESEDKLCRYIDDYHVEIGNNLYHICEYAERIEASGAKVIPLRSNLPDKCYIYIKETGTVALLKKGERGYFATDILCDTPENGEALVNHYNAEMGITEAQAQAMMFGSMFGWHVSAANPYAFAEMARKPGVRNAKVLASKLVTFMEAYDYFDFHDGVEDTEKEMSLIVQDIIAGQTEHYLNGLREIADDEEIDSDVRWLADQLAQQFEKIQ